jgi:hypothetical protein
MRIFSPTFVILTLLTLHSTKSNAQWVQTNRSYNGTYNALAGSGTSLFVGTNSLQKNLSWLESIEKAIQWTEQDSVSTISEQQLSNTIETPPQIESEWNEKSYIIYAGPSIPTGDFGNNGVAKLGGFIGFDMLAHFTPDIGGVLSFVLSRNSVDMPSSDGAGAWMSAWGPMIGVSAILNLSPQDVIYPFMQGGLLYVVAPGQITSSGQTEATNAFAFGVGVGMIHDIFSLGVRYYSARPTFEPILGFTEQWTMSIETVQVSAGIAF